MSTATLTSFDDTAFHAALKRALNSIEDGSAKALYTTGNRIVSETKRRAPVDTGRLRASYIAHPGHDGRGPYVQVGTSLFYAAYVEYGTRHQHSQPHFRPGLLAGIEAWAQAARQITPRI